MTALGADPVREKSIKSTQLGCDRAPRRVSTMVKEGAKVGSLVGQGRGQEAVERRRGKSGKNQMLVWGASLDKKKGERWRPAAVEGKGRVRTTAARAGHKKNLVATMWRTRKVGKGRLAKVLGQWF